MGDLAKALGATLSSKDRDKVTAAVARHLMAPSVNTRAADRIHPSALASDSWCARATYYGMVGTEPVMQQRNVVMEVVFETGHQSHEKWQTWLWEMGLLKGMWKCIKCQNYWEDQSPGQCPNCKGGKQFIRYREVPVESEEYLIRGNADGDVDVYGPIEIKTIGIGTVRHDAPHLIDRFTYHHEDTNGKLHTGVDMEALWRAIRVPFPSHIKQGMIYCFCMGWDRITFIYEPKFITAMPKEFTIRFRRDMVEDMLDECLIVKQALKDQRPPKRPIWAETDHKTCTSCANKGVCWNGRAGDGRPDAADRTAAAASEGGTAAPGPPAPRKARVRFAPPPGGRQLAR